MEYYLDAFLLALRAILNAEHSLLDPLFRSLKLASLATLIASAIGLSAAFAIAFNDFWGKRLLLGLLSSLFAMPSVAIGIFLYGFLMRKGPLGQLSWLYTEQAIVIGEVLLSLPIITRIAVASLSSIDVNIRYTLLSLGANRWQLALLSLREASTGIAVAVMMGFARAISEVGVALQLGGNIAGKTRTMTTAIALEASKGQFVYALSLGILLTLVFLALNIMILRLQDDG